MAFKSLRGLTQGDGLGIFGCYFGSFLIVLAVRDALVAIIALIGAYYLSKHIIYKDKKIND